MTGGRIAALLWCFLAPGTAAADWIADFEAGRIHESNLPRAQLRSDIRSDAAAVASASLTHFSMLDDRNGLTFGADLRAVEYDHVSGLSNYELGAVLGIRSKFGLGLSAPWVKAQARAARQYYRNDARDAMRYELGASVGKRFGERFEAVLGLSYDKRDGKHDRPVATGISGAAFDVQGRTASLQTSYDVDESWQLQAGFSVRKGGVVSSTRRNFAIFQASSAIAADPAFGPDYFAYALPGTTRTFTFGVSRALGTRASINLGAARELTSARSNLDYRNTSVQAAFAYRY